MCEVGALIKISFCMMDSRYSIVHMFLVFFPLLTRKQFGMLPFTKVVFLPNLVDELLLCWIYTQKKVVTKNGMEVQASALWPATSKFMALSSKTKPPSLLQYALLIQIG